MSDLQSRSRDNDLKLSPDDDPSLEDKIPALNRTNAVESGAPDVQVYRLYKRRYAGLLGMIILNIVIGMSWPWFGPIAFSTSAEFGISLTRVNWLGTVSTLIFLPVSLVTPLAYNRFGLRRCLAIGSALLILSSWIRYAGTARSLSSNGAYALLMFGQILAGIAQPLFSILGPRYSEAWFSLNGRTTATMLIAISMPVGEAIGQLVSPVSGNPRQSVLVIGIICTVAAPAYLLVASAPPTPPTYAGSKHPGTPMSFLRAWVGLPTSDAARMTWRERIDFTIMFILYGVMNGAANDLTIFSAQYVQPYGYSEFTASYLGAILLIAGVVSALIAAPILDRVLYHQFALIVKIIIPIAGTAWLAFIWAVRPNDVGGLYALTVLVGVICMPMLPLGLELGCEITRNAAGSSAALGFSANLFSFIFFLVSDALRSGPDANPPYNMHKALLFNGITTFVCCMTVFGFQGKQVRRALDEEKLKEATVALA